MAKHPQPQVTNQPAPVGQRLESNLGPGTLYPGVGKIVQRTGLPQRAGTITALVFGYEQHPNSKNPGRMSVRFAGQFMLVDHGGRVITGAECYLPPSLTRAVRAALDMRGSGGQPVPVSVEVWCEPDPEGRPASPVGYQWITYDRAPRGEDDPLLMLAYASGVIERPAVALPAPGPDLPEDVDPETGEITGPAETRERAA